MASHLYEGLKVKVAQSRPTLCDAMDYTVHGILQARILEWGAIAFSKVKAGDMKRGKRNTEAGSWSGDTCLTT